jgi:hypothetical protein
LLLIELSLSPAQRRFQLRISLRLVLSGCAGLLFSSILPLSGQTSDPPKEESPIQDNSFLIEEAYNQEKDVVQHISTFSRMWNSKDWAYTFTQEWPAPHNWRHQLSYTLVTSHSGGYPGSGEGWGDMILNYRYQLIGDGEKRLAVSPRISMLVPTGNVTLGRGAGGVGVQINIPVSFVLTRRLVTHWNAGGTWTPHAQDYDHCQAPTIGYNVGQSFVFLAHPRFNVLVETLATRFQSVMQPGATQWGQTLLYTSPGVRWAHNFKSGLQIVPGVGIPIGIGPSAGQKGIFLYLSFEHPFGRPS